nr:hypothetical protein [uncultured Bacillus sp.]
MNEVLVIQDMIISGQHELLLVVDNHCLLGDVKATGQMLVDSAGFSFVYLLENHDSYTYIKLPEVFWSNLKKAIACRLTVSLTNGREKLYLTNFLKELGYLIENIKGNSNYGEEMVYKVEAVF